MSPGSAPRPSTGPPRARPSATAAGLIKEEHRTGDRVRCLVLEEKTKKGGWRFEVTTSGAQAILHPSSVEPPQLVPGKELEMIVKASGKPLQLVWEPDAG